jgi:hypothetical protein
METLMIKPLLIHHIYIYFIYYIYILFTIYIYNIIIHELWKTPYTFQQSLAVSIAAGSGELTGPSWSRWQWSPLSGEEQQKR